MDFILGTVGTIHPYGLVSSQGRGIHLCLSLSQNEKKSFHGSPVWVHTF